MTVLTWFIAGCCSLALLISASKFISAVVEGLRQCRLRSRPCAIALDRYVQEIVLEPNAYQRLNRVLNLEIQTSRSDVILSALLSFDPAKNLLNISRPQMGTLLVEAGLVVEDEKGRHVQDWPTEILTITDYEARQEAYKAYRVQQRFLGR